MLAFDTRLRIKRNHMRPHSRRGCKSASDRIAADVIPFFRIMRLIANTRVEKILLKPYLVSRRQIRLPMSDDICESPIRRNMYQHVDMIRHHEEQVQHPFAQRLIESSSIQDDCRLIRQLGGIPFRRHDRDEIHGVGNIDRQRTAVVHRFANRQLRIILQLGIHNSKSHTISHPAAADRPECDPYPSTPNVPTHIPR